MDRDDVVMDTPSGEGDPEGFERELVMDGPEAAGLEAKKEEEGGVGRGGESTPSPLIFDGDDIPAALKGKGPQDAIDYARRLEQALRMSEEAREQSVRMSRVAPQPTQIPTPQRLTETEIEAAMTKDPASARQAIQSMINQGRSEAEQQLAQRFAAIESMVANSRAAAETDAKRRYPLEFQEAGSYITSLVAGLPDQSLASPQQWDQVIAYVRGSEQYYDRLHQARSRARAQEHETQIAGPSPRSGSRPAARHGSPGTVIDATTREIMRGMDIAGMNDPDNPSHVREWNKWKGGK